MAVRNNSLSAQIDNYSNQMQDRANAAVLELYGELVKNTPVGNPSLWLSGYHPKGYVGGTARANWRIVETPDNEIIHSTSVPTTPTLPTQWTKLYIINNVPYIVPLEYGHSRQIEAGWIRRSVDRFNLILRGQN
ncbi:hypothetical protein DM558_07590 [Entomomonas moraniae]|uniref:HK97 gp10 family phage protein n=1 Tax=Entomomonas moraniae TaxID=2213226 RepID=A0A3S9XDL0_9GAMM|nr:hypothetical protein [Entomomonas moraniae]AZS50398.1 hypothetical protein DM558_06235 [Entomomonas moraniae]AZS50649.1 hypothetical protein DM558_07590 [Entomomonas moraniae]